MIIGGYDYISEADFDQHWGARPKANGELYSLGEIRSLPIDHVWTVLEGDFAGEIGMDADRNWYASPGIHVVNALGYLITAKSWNGDTPDAIWYWDNGDWADLQ